jgi:transcriptional regulator with XRE-family HTH domain
MANQNLKNALQDAGLTTEQFAEIIQVDPKTVGRWIAGASTPYPRHRAKITGALALPEAELWPELTDGSPATYGEQSGVPGQQNSSISAWASSSDESAPDPVDFIATGTGPIDLLAAGLWLDLPGPITHALLALAGAGRQIRLLAAVPTPGLKPLAGHERIQLRVGGQFHGHELIRTGETLIFIFPLPGEYTEPPPLVKLQRATDDDLFDRLTRNFEALWDDADKAITDPDQLEEYRTNADDDTGDTADPEAPGQPGANMRRWPGRRD